MIKEQPKSQHRFSCYFTINVDVSKVSHYIKYIIINIESMFSRTYNLCLMFVLLVVFLLKFIYVFINT